MSADEATPIVFGRSPRDLFAFFHPARGARVRDTAVVLCNPLGHDVMCVHRTYWQLADRLASAGFPAFRFDYEGTGDSSGHPEAPGRVRAWRDNIQDAADEARALSGAAKLALFGVRFGGTLAALAARERSDVDALVLWAPPLTGKAWVRELRAFRQLKGEVAGGPRPDGAEDFAGYLFSRETLAELSELKLLDGKARPVRRVMLLPRDVAGGDDRLAAHLGAAGCEVNAPPKSAFSAMLRDAQDTVVPEADLDSIVGWLREGAAELERPPGRALAPRPTLSVSTPRGAASVETPISFGPAGRLFGLLSEPADAAPKANRPAALFLNVGANHHVGPHRLYVTLARELAAAGYCCLRFDVAGLGDSAPTGEAAKHVYSRDAVADVKAAMDTVAALRGVQRFILLGICSGAYLAYHTALEDPRVVGQVLLNPQTFEWKEGDSIEVTVRQSFKSTRFYARALLEPEVWRRVVRGQVNLRGIASTLKGRLANRLASELGVVRARVTGATGPQSEVERAFAAMSERGVESLLAFSFNDGGLDMIEKHLGPEARKLRARTNFRFVVIDGADHTFTPQPSQEALRELIMNHVTRSFR
jgi:alpha-beta hydrolase superfamily lysophospholipase